MGAPTSILADCVDQNRDCVEADDGTAFCGPCVEGFTTEDSRCRPVETCLNLRCAERNRECADAEANRDAECLDCLPGTFRTETGECVRASCTPETDGGSLATVCAEQNRICEPVNGGAVCGGCIAGTVEIDGACVALSDCTELGCEDANRSCELSAAAEASCGACLPGFELFAGNCVADPTATCAAGDPNSVLDACDALNRECVGGACGACSVGFYFDEALGRCEPSVDCATCDARDRECITEGPANRCGGCALGFVEDSASGQCRPVRTCAEVDCPAGEICVDGAGRADAACRVDCGSGLFDGSGCVPCPPCAETDPAGRDTGERGVEPRVTSTGQCICQTAPGYFYSLAGDVGTFLCDEDGDGWVRRSARSSVESEDPVLRDNARCDVRTIDRFILENEYGDRREEVLSDPLPLYETVRNDDDQVLRVTWDRLDLPVDFDPSFIDFAGSPCSADPDCEDDEVCRIDPTLGGYCTAVVRPSAKALNPLTKMCHAVLTDYNDNGVADVSEWGTQAVAGLTNEERTLLEFSYFAELHVGAFLPSLDDPSRGAYLIRERSRVTVEPGELVPLDYSVDEGSHWRECTVRRDAQWSDFAEPVGMDFARFEPNPDAYLLNSAVPQWRGMTHHSLFKCLVVTAEPAEQRPQEVTREALQESDSPYELNTCRYSGEQDLGAGDPSHPVLDCAPDLADPRPGDVVWAGVRYLDYANAADLTPYVRGCVNGCAEARLRADAQSDVSSYDCPTAAGNALACDRDDGDFGRLECQEACGDGLDNDGDGSFDEIEWQGSPSSLGAACDTGEFGICAPGTLACTLGNVFCDQTFPAEDIDLCNGLDDDCDDELDEDDQELPPAPRPRTNPLRAGQECTVSSLEGVCRDGMLVCDTRPLVGVPTTQLFCEQVVFPSPELCDGLDNDCTGGPDNGTESTDPDIGIACVPDSLDDLVGSSCPDAVGLVGVCGETETKCIGGEPSCQPARRLACPEARTPAPFSTTIDLLCDGLDNDCDGTPDEGDVCRGRRDFSLFANADTVLAGDAEFAGNGPRMNLNVSYSVDGTVIVVDVTLTFTEDGGDGSTIQTTEQRRYNTGRTVARVLSSGWSTSYLDDDDDEDDVLVGSGVTDSSDPSPPAHITGLVCEGDTPGDDIDGSRCTITGFLDYEAAP